MSGVIFSKITVSEFSNYECQCHFFNGKSVSVSQFRDTSGLLYNTLKIKCSLKIIGNVMNKIYAEVKKIICSIWYVDLRNCMLSEARQKTVGS